MQNWRTKVLTAVGFGLWTFSSYGSSPSVGLFVTKADVGGARNSLCVKAMPDGRYDVDVFTAYCPSKECTNTRFGEMSGQARNEGSRIHLVEKRHCELVIKFNKNSARIEQDIKSCDGSDTSYLKAAGLYQLIRSDVREQDCGPTGPNVCDPGDTTHKMCP